MAHLILGKEKLDVDTSKMDEEWRTNSGRVKEYCLQDTRLSHEILTKIHVLEKYQAIAEVARLPMFDCLLDRNSIYIDSLLIRAADRDNPRGYYEFERVKKTKQDPSWLADARGKAVKMVSSLSA